MVLPEVKLPGYQARDALMLRNQTAEQSLLISQDLVSIIDPSDEDAVTAWLRCRDNWLDDLEARSKRGNTRRAYSASWIDFFSYWQSRKVFPWTVGRVHAQGWVQAIRNRGLSDATVNRQVAALSSFYRYAGEEFEIKGSDGLSRTLWEHPNPFGSRKLRAQIKPYGRSRGRVPSTEQVAALLRHIDTDTPQGLRDMALLLGMFVTTRRITEWSQLRGSDIRDSRAGKIFEYRYKGGEIKQQSMPASVWAIIENYLRADCRWPLQGDAPIFVASWHTASVKRAITPRRVNMIIRKYGKMAGLPDGLLHAHALRHAGARARHAAGEDIVAIKDILGHSSIATTQIYLDALDEPVDDMAGLIAGLVLPDGLTTHLPEKAD